MNFSIHPRNHPRGNGNKINTCAPRNERKKQKRLRKASAWLNTRRLDHERTIKNLPSTVPATAYPQPGSMRKGK